MSRPPLLRCTALTCYTPLILGFGVSGMRRREFISLLGGAVTAWPLAARAQQAAMPAIGYLGTLSARWDAERLPALRQSLAEAGYSEGSNVAIEYSWAEGDYDRLPAQAAEFVRRGVAVILAGS